MAARHPVLALDAAVAAGALALRRGDREPLTRALEEARSNGYELAAARARRLLGPASGAP
jgi:hypothetical protein